MKKACFPKVLIAIPTYEGMKYCLNDFIIGLKSLIYDNFEVLFVDNSHSDTYFNLIQEQGYAVIKSKRFKNPRETIVNSRNLLRQIFLNGDYDYFFSVEQDVILTSEIIPTMLSLQKEIVSGVYYKTKGALGFKVYYPVLMTACDENGNIIETNKDDCLIRDMYREEVEIGKLIKVEASGLGCVMIARRVLEKVEFRYEEEKNAYDDMFFAIDTKKQGFQIWADTGLKCKHILEGKPEY
ncbi:hypothetical protein J4418_00430 [Candidatus Woesearchaeota archaeon]|nr:hypothetical protein [Candidatus Woesearchaeota archaeon]